MAMDLRNRIDADLGIVVSLATFLQGPSIDDLVAELADAQAERRETHAALPAAPADETDLPLSHGQQALWLTHQLAPRSTAYHIMFAARLVGGVDAAAMERAVRALVDRHDSLRTTYAAGPDGRPVQRVQAQPVGCFAFAEAGGLDDAELHARLGAEADRPFDLERGPLFRVTLFRRADDEHVLLLVVHHLAVDFWSLEVLVEELRALYEAARSGQTASLPATRQYTDFVRWQRGLLAGPAGDRLWDYWQRKLSGDLPLLALPTDRPRPRVQTYRGALCDFTLDERLSARLRDLARAEGATPYATLLAAFAALLARYTGQDDLLIGTPMAGRGRADFERTVGYLVNVLPLRADLAGEPSFRELLRRMRDTVLEALDHQDFPFSLLVERLVPTRDPGRSPLVELLFIWYRSALLEASGGEASSVMAWEQRGAPYDLMLLMTEANDRLLGRFQYNADLFEAATMARLAEHFRRLLESVVADPDRPVSAARMLTAAERVQQMVSWNDTEAAYPADACLHDLFEAQAARTPDATALVWGTERLTYRELNRRANRVARELRARGVGPEVLVGLCVERTPAMVVGAAGRAQGRRGVRAARSGLSGGAAGVHAPRLRGGGAGDAAEPRREAGRARPERRLPGRPGVPRADRRRRRRASGLGRHAEQPGLRDLHLRLDRPAEGRGDRAPGAGRAGRLGARSLRRGEPGRRAGVDLDLLRPQHLRAVRAALLGRHGDPGRERPGAAAPAGRRRGHAGQHASPRRWRSCCGPARCRPRSGW